MNRELNFEQLQKKLKKVLNPSRFRFVVILYPNTNMIDEIKEHISSTYPESSKTSLNLKDKSYQEIAPELYKNNEGFVYINDFDEILNNPDLYNGFNQRRDKIASFNINLICFISLYQKDELFTKAINVIPDLWEFKNTVLELEKDDNTNKLTNVIINESSSYSSIGGLTTKDKEIELKKLLIQLEETKSAELKFNLLYQIAVIYKDIGKFNKALSYFLKRLKLSKKMKLSKENIAVINNDISTIYHLMGDLNKALEYQTKAINLYGEKHPYLKSSYSNISAIYKDMGELSKALEYQTKAINLYKEKDSDLATCYNIMSLIYQKMGKFNKALEFQNKSLKIRKDNLSHNHPDLAISYHNISTIYYQMGQLNKALMFQNKSLNVRKEMLGNNHFYLASSYNEIALIYWKMKDIINAKKYIDKAINILKYNFPNGHPSLDTAISIQSNIYNAK